MAVPSGYGIGANKNYYFSHMLNCCTTADTVFTRDVSISQLCLVVNYEDFQHEIKQLCADTPNEAMHFSPAMIAIAWLWSR